MSGHDDQQGGYNQMPSWAELTIETILEGQLVAAEMAIASANTALMGAGGAVAGYVLMPIGVGFVAAGSPALAVGAAVTAGVVIASKRLQWRAARGNMSSPNGTRRPRTTWRRCGRGLTATKAS